MLSRIRITNETDDSIDFRMGRTSSSHAFSIENLDGTGPVKADVAFTNYTLIPGGVFHSANQGIRNITIQASLKPDYSANQSVGDLFTLLNERIIPGEKVRLNFYHDDIWTHWIDGYVETQEPNRFTKEPTVDISIVCVDIPFAAPSSISTTVQTGVSKSFQYLGNYKDGMFVELTAAAALTYFQIEDTVTGDKIRINTAVAAGQKLRVQMRKGLKFADVTTAGGTTVKNALGDLVVTGKWPELRRGTNTYRFTQSSATSSDVEFIYRNYYGGI